jgi:hypothetical protein
MLEISSGTRPANVADGSIPYSDAAVVPREPWRSLSFSAVSALFKVTAEWEQHRSAAILRPNAALEALLTRENLATRGYRREDYPEISKAFVSALAGECEFAPDYVFHGIARDAPGMLTVSINKDLNRIVGLHVDSWDRMPLEQRRFARNRISINLGPSARYILFVPATLDDMASLLSRERGMHVDWPKLPTVFMQEFEDFPVVRCRLPPGASYILPTENMLHDGSTEGQAAAVRNAVYRGHIRPLYTKLAA